MTCRYRNENNYQARHKYLLLLLITSCFVVAPFGCLLDYDLQGDNAESTDIDDIITESDEEATNTDNGSSFPPETDAESDTDDTPQDSDYDTGVIDKDSETNVTPADTATDSSQDTEPENVTAKFCQEAEEDEYMFLECGTGGIIDRISFASFGQYVGSCGLGFATIGECHFEGTTSVIENECLGKSSCQLIADKKEVFGDACRKDDHFLIVKYICRYNASCPQGSLKKVPGKCGCNTPDKDRDGDGSADCNDQCADEPTKMVEDACGCNVDFIDEDRDGVPNCIDECDDDEHKTKPGLCGCGKKDDDIDDQDGDGTIDCLDKCKDDPNKIDKGICGCNKEDDPTDSDRDGTADCADKCPNDPNKKDPGDCGCGRADTFLCLF